MYVGHIAWITPVVFLGMFMVRSMTSSRRRRGGGRGPMPPGNAFTGRPGGGRSPGSHHHHEVSGGAPGTADLSGHTGTAPGWFRDPFVKHEERYWSGSTWTEHVTDHGVPAIDPPPATGGARGTDD